MIAPESLFGQQEATVRPRAGGAVSMAVENRANLVTRALGGSEKNA